ncbi:MAG: hypothetical protein M3Q95_11785 [Bacteroidota bacterium]|nr:hypothetical protein [Bacteroidota bacterium]
MQQHSVSSEILSQLIKVTRQLNDEQFSHPLAILSGNTFGKHIRHIIEFYICLVDGYKSGVVNYDLRKHYLTIENDKHLAVMAMNEILSAIDSLEDKPLILHVSYNVSGNVQVNATSFNRELVCNIEHAIHYTAILKIAIATSFPQVQLPENFGVAHSTIRFAEQQCAQ